MNLAAWPFSLEPMAYNVFLGGVAEDPRQLEMFPQRNPAAEALRSLAEHSAEIDAMYELMQKVLGEPGSARKARGPSRKRNTSGHLRRPT